MGAHETKALQVIPPSWLYHGIVQPYNDMSWGLNCAIQQFICTCWIVRVEKQLRKMFGSFVSNHLRWDRYQKHRDAQRSILEHVMSKACGQVTFSHIHVKTDLTTPNFFVYIACNNAVEKVTRRHPLPNSKLSEGEEQGGDKKKASLALHYFTYEERGYASYFHS